jgi:hypothetical protein
MRITVLSLMLLIAGSVVMAQTVVEVHPEVSSVVGRMKSQSWTDRSQSFDDARNLLVSRKLTPGDSDKLSLGLIQLLATERKAAVHPKNEDEAESYSEYRSGIIDVVSHLGDERAIPVLLSVASSGGMAIRGVARFGEKALGPTLEQVKSGDPDLAEGAVFVVQKFLERRTISDRDSQLRIKDALRSALVSPGFNVREAAIYAVEYLDDRDEFVPMLKEVAEHDPFKLSGKPDDGGDNGVFYPVRQNARRLLRKIADHTPPDIDRGISD